MIRFMMAFVAIWHLLSPNSLHAQSACTVPWTLEETLRIGSIDGDDALSSVMDLAVGPDGDVYVTQFLTPRVTVFTAAGQFDRTIGRAGQGPGEFDHAAMQLGWIGDTLWVADASAVHFFGPNEAESRQVRFSARLENEGSRFRAGRPLSDGSFLGGRTISGDIPAFFLADRLSVPRFSEQGEILDTIARISQRLIVQPSGFTSHPLDGVQGTGWLKFAVTVDGAALVLLGEVRSQESSPSFDLLKIGVTGDTIWKRSIAYEPKPVTRADRSWSTEVFGNYMAGEYQPDSKWAGQSEAQAERERRAGEEAITFPRYHPPVRQIVAGHDGSVWLLRELMLPDLVDRWDMYDVEGSFEGMVVIAEGQSNRVPWYPRLKLLRATRDELWGATVGDWDEPYVHRYRVDRSCG